MMTGIRRLNLKTKLGKAGNEREWMSLLDAIERSRLSELPSSWSSGGMLRIISTGRADSGVDHCYYNRFTGSFMSEAEAQMVL